MSAKGVIASVKPRLRGWIHAGTAPLALAACIVLTVLAPGAGLKWACAVYLTCSLLLFANSGVYHIGTGHWPAKVEATLRRIDHANIYLLIAGTYTPLSAALLPTRTATLVLGIVWAGAAIGTATNLLWMHAPRWFTTALYIILGWVGPASAWPASWRFCASGDGGPSWPRGGHGGCWARWAVRHAVEPAALSASLPQPLRRRRSGGPARIRPPRRPTPAPEYSSIFRQPHSIPSGCGVDSRVNPGRPHEEPPGVVVAR